MRVPLLPLVLLLLVPPLAAQVPDTAGADTARSVDAVRAWQVGALAGAAVVGMVLLDEPIRDYFQDHQSPTADDVSEVVEYLGRFSVVGPIGGAIMLGGLVAKQPEVIRVGGRAIAAVLAAQVVVQPLKYGLGRVRPSGTDDALDFEPFSGNAAFPSGHSSVAFAFFGSLAMDVGNPWAAAGLYLVAGSVAWQRMYANAHWFTDVGVSAVIGIASARFVRGDLMVFGVRAPSILRAPDGRMAVGWSLDFSSGAFAVAR